MGRLPRRTRRRSAHGRGHLAPLDTPAGSHARSRDCGSRRVLGAVQSRRVRSRSGWRFRIRDHGVESRRSSGVVSRGLLSSLLFTAIPEELVFRAYLQQKFTALADGETRRTVATGVAVAAVLFALFHLPRWFLGSGHGVGTALAVRLLGLTLMGIAYGVVYALTGNLWLVALFHATMNQPPFVVTVSVPAELHLLVGVVEYAAIVSTVYVAVRVTEPEESALVWSRRAASSTSD
ncbi:type II CAAX prenyl endopeptidase Rce1 family protein [Halorussus caseinilyticus]|uniref:Type II CAAX prenyl endopeptidase Rce1 family protein n=1 Tax=Halorussus caseinilyticus TaxID=3034025 RepID=A0ABD5WLN3_9EURY